MVVLVSPEGMSSDSILPNTNQIAAWCLDQQMSQLTIRKKHTNFSTKPSRHIIIPKTTQRTRQFNICGDIPTNILRAIENRAALTFNALRGTQGGQCRSSDRGIEVGNGQT